MLRKTYGELTEILPRMTARRVERFSAKIDQSGGLDACHPFSPATHKQGYGMVQGSEACAGFTFLAHRVAWALANNNEPGCRIVRHSCDNPPCCNPRHLLVGDHQANVDDMVERERPDFWGSKGRRGHAANAADFTAEQRARAIVLRYSARWQMVAIAQVIGCHRGTLSRWFGEYETGVADGSLSAIAPLP